MDYDRVPPHSEEAEIGVLGSIFLEPTKVLDICIQKRLTVDSFYIPAHKIVFEAVGNLVGLSKPVDILTVTAELKRSKSLDNIGGQKFLDDIIDKVFTYAHAEHHIDELKNKWLLRKIASIGNDIVSQAYTSDDPELLRSNCETLFMSLYEGGKTPEVIDVFEDIQKNVEDALNGKVIELGIPTGFFELDKLNEGGMRDGGVYWMSGMEGTGKTSLKCNIILNQLRNKVPVGDLTLEMTLEQELEKLAGIYCDQNISRVIRRVERMDLTNFMSAKKLIAESKDLFMADQSSVRSINEFASWAKRMVERNKCRLLCVDYFQLLGADGGRKLSIEELTSAQSTAIKDVAGMLKVPLLCIAEKNKEGKIRGSRRADYAGAGHWQLSKNEDEEGQAPFFWKNIELFLRKGRFSADNSSLALRFKASTGLFQEGTVSNGHPDKKFEYEDKSTDGYGDSQFNL